MLPTSVTDLLPDIAEELTNGNVPRQMYEASKKMEQAIIKKNTDSNVSDFVVNVSKNMPIVKSFIKDLQKDTRKVVNQMITKGLHNVDEMFGLTRNVSIYRNLTGIVEQGILERNNLTNEKTQGVKKAFVS